MGRNPLAYYRRDVISPHPKRKRKNALPEEKEAAEKKAAAEEAKKQQDDVDGQEEDEWQFQENEDEDEAWQEVKDSGITAVPSNPGKSIHEAEPELKKGSLLRSAKELYQPPTRQELEELKATSDLFKSNLFKLQMNEMIKEIFVSTPGDGFLKTAITKIKTVLEGLKDRQLKLKPDSQLRHGVHHAGIAGFNPDEVVLDFKAPEVQVVGSYMIGTVARPHCNVDVTVSIPTECFQVKDYMNFRYFHKRSAYLSHIADALMKVKYLKDLKFSTVVGGGNRPILVATPVDPEATHKSKFVIRIHPVISSETFEKHQRLFPTRNNLRVAKSTEILKKCGCKINEDLQPATPHYNNEILLDMLHRQHLQFIAQALRPKPDERSALQDAVLLLKTWLSQRKMGAGYPGTLSGFAATMIVLHVKKSKKLARSVSAYQMFKTAISFLADTDLSVEGAQMEFEQFDGMPTDCPTLEEFNKAFHVVLVDPSHCVNILGNMSRGTYRDLRHEAKLAKMHLDHPDDKFHALFLQPILPCDKFDLCINVTVRPSTCAKYPGQLLDWGGNWKGFAAILIQTLLTRGLTDRIHFIAPVAREASEWAVTDTAPWCDGDEEEEYELQLGLVLDRQHAFKELDVGPSAEETDAAAAFRNFWGDVSELRRFQDGSINEAVVWPSSPNRKHLVMRNIITHLLKRHVNIPASDIAISTHPMEVVLSSSEVIEDRGFASSNAVSEAFHELAGKIRRLDGMPLMITAIQCVAPTVRYCEVFPPEPNGNSSDDGGLPWVQALPCYLTVEQSGKWPDNYDAIQHVKSAMFIRLATLLKTTHGIRSSVSATHADVLYGGYAFRMQLFVDRELALTKRSVTNLESAVQALKAAGTPKPEVAQAYKVMVERNLSLREHMVFRPYHHTSILAIALAHGAFSSAVRLAKRWVASHFFHDDLTEPAVELIVAHLFVNPAPFTAPGTPEVAFLRFLFLLSTHNWLETPLIIDFLGDISASSYAAISEHFREHRKSLPTMFLATAKDSEQSIWTQNAPSKQSLVRIVQYASQSLQTVRNWVNVCFQSADKAEDDDAELATGDMVSTLFRTPLSMYQILIHLESGKVPRRYQELDYEAPAKRKRKYKNLEEDESDKSPPKINFDPPSLLLHQLRAQFGDSLLFFYNPHGGKVIAAVINPQVLQPFPFKVPYAMNSKVMTSSDSKETKAAFHIEAAMETIKTIGRGLIQKVELSSN